MVEIIEAPKAFCPFSFFFRIMIDFELETESTSIHLYMYDWGKFRLLGTINLSAQPGHLN